MQVILQKLSKQWKETPLWAKLIAILGMSWSLVYLASAVQIWRGLPMVAFATSGFESYTFILKVGIISQFVLLGFQIVLKLNQKTLGNPSIRLYSVKVRKYFQRFHPTLGIAWVLMAFAHALVQFSQFWQSGANWSTQSLSGVVGISLLLLITLSGDGVLFLRGAKRKKIFFVHAVIAILFAIPFLLHI